MAVVLTVRATIYVGYVADDLHNREQYHCHGPSLMSVASLSESDYASSSIDLTSNESSVQPVWTQVHHYGDMNTTLVLLSRTRVPSFVMIPQRTERR
jgi:hypothetical protein